MSCYKKRSGLLLLSAMVMLSAACSSTPPVVLPPSAQIPPPTIPRLSPELRLAPLPSGHYWKRVTEWRKTWGETVNSSQPRSEGSSEPTNHCGPRGSEAPSTEALTSVGC